MPPALSAVHEGSMSPRVAVLYEVAARLIKEKIMSSTDAIAHPPLIHWRS